MRKTLLLLAALQLVSLPFLTQAGAVQLAAGNGHSVVMKDDGSVWAWGDNTYGQLGDGTAIVKRLTPVKVPTFGNVSSISANYQHTVAVKHGGTAWAWGFNGSGQLGNGTTAASSSPVPVTTTSGLNNIVAVSTGATHTVALTNDYAVWAWGNNANFFNQLGDGTNIPSNSPVQVTIDDLRTPMGGITAIAAGGNHSLALDVDNIVWGWGNNGYGQLGDNSTTTRTYAVQAVYTGPVVAIAAGYMHSVALQADGSVWTWGSYSQGQLGRTTSTNSLDPNYFAIPVQVPNLTEIIAIAAGGAYGSTNGSHTVALKSDGTVWAWGSNTKGQLGDGTIVQRNSPVQVPGLTGIIAIEAGANHTLALKNDGTVWAWGGNDNGQLGDGTTTNRLAPVKVGDLSGSDTTPPVTTVTPAGGAYSTPQNVTLTCSDTGGTGCVVTYYCTGSGCTPTTPYTGAIPVAGTTDINYYSTDIAWNSESVRTASYLFPPATPTVSLGTVGASSFTITWNAVSTATSYRLDVSTDSSFGSFVGTYQDLNIGNITGFDVTGLTYGTTYYYRLRASNAAGASGNSITGSVFTPVPKYALTVSLAGTGSGSVNTTSCSGTCTDLSALDAGTQLTLTATPDWKSLFSGWSGICSGTGTCTAIMSGNTAVTATFGANYQARLVPPGTPYASLQEAYNAADVTNNTIQARIYTFVEDLTLNKQITVQLNCGYGDDTYATMSGLTSLHGLLTINQGAAVIRNLIIR